MFCELYVIESQTPLLIVLSDKNNKQVFFFDFPFLKNPNKMAFTHFYSDKRNKTSLEIL